MSDEPADSRMTGEPADSRMTGEPADSREQRRALLLTDASPAAGIDYLVRLEAAGAGVRVTVDYVPDKLVLRPAALGAYMAALRADGLEALAVTVLDDLNNEVVPRFVRLRLAGADGHMALLADRQPNWDNPALLAQLERF